MWSEAPGNSNELTTLRRLYARRILASAGASDDAALEAAFAQIPREAFLGPPPWGIVPGLRGLPGRDVFLTSDPSLLYQDALVQLQALRGVNNGSPSLHAFWLHELAPRAGERVTHIGAGTGYYTAILSRLVGPGGHVTAVEFDAELAERARTNLAAYGNVEVVCDDGAHWPREPADCVYVNFGVGRPAAAWLDNLARNGRLIFPLCAEIPETKQGRARQSTGGQGGGVGMLVTRREHGFAARSLCPCGFVYAVGALTVSAEENQRLLAAFQKRGAEFVGSLKWREPVDPERCFYVGSDWALGYDEPV